MWSPVMVHYTGHGEAALVPVVRLLMDFHWHLHPSGFTGIIHKYDSPHFHLVGSLLARLPQSERFDCLRLERRGGRSAASSCGDEEDSCRSLLNRTPEPFSSAASTAHPGENQQDVTQTPEDDEAATDVDDEAPPAPAGGREVSGIGMMSKRKK